MYIPKYSITTAILKDVGAVEASREVIENAPLVPTWEAKFQDEAKLRAAHYGTMLEGNDLTFNEAKIIVEGDMDSTKQAADAGVVARERDIQEVINYRRVLDYIESLSSGGQPENFAYTPDLLFNLHKLVVDKLIDPDQSGSYRTSQVVLRNSVTGEIGFRPPPALEVPFLIEEFFRWLSGDFGRKEHPVIRAAVTHYVLAAVHPFVEGNGRSARAFATLVLFMEGYDIKRFFALEEYFDKNAEDYFGSLMQVSNQSPKLEDRDLTPWIETFTKALAIELVRIKEKIRQLSLDIKIKERQGKQVALNERQMKLMEYFTANGEATMAQVKTLFPMVSEDTVLRELKYLIEKGIIAKKGSTKAARYVLNK